MKKEAAINSFKVLVLALVACFASIALYGFSARAADALPAIAYKNFGVSYVSKNSVDVSFNTEYNDVKGEVQLCNSSKKVLQVKTGYRTAFFSCKISDNSVYYYRVRPFYEDYKTQTTTYGPWTKYKAFSTIVLKLKKSSGRSFKVKCPKLPKVVKTVNLMMSTARNSGFKKVASVKPGKKSKAIKKLKGKKFVSYKTYYLKPAPVLKDGVFCENAYLNNFYWTRVYR